MNYFQNLYTLIEIAINLNIKKISFLSKLMNEKKTEEIIKEFPELKKFIPYCKWYVLQERNVLAMVAYFYDIYKDTGLLPDIEKYDYNPDTKRLEYWQYINPPFFEINPEEGFEFANELYQGCDIWNLFLSGSARMNYYEEKDTDLEQRIKYAIVEYMVRRPQFYSIDDFYDNEILHRKYGKKNKNGGDKECQK